jgi:3-oxoacyl-[acyl-carrier protein] reductase
MLTLKGRTAVVTGGSRGIGFAVVREFAENGMKVAIMSVQRDSAANAAMVLADKGLQCSGYRCDVSDEDSVRKTLKKINEDLGAIDVVVNSAAILDMYKIQEMPMNYWDEVMAINVRGTFIMIKESISYLERSRAARIINISSNAGRMGGFENGMAYSASKGAIIALTYGTARELASKRITVNCVAPGTIQSDMAKQRDQETQKRLLVRFPVGRFGTPEEIAAAVSYFASEESAFTTGAVLDVNGGLFMG